MYNDFGGARYYYNPYYPYNTLEEKHKFLEKYKECVDVLMAIGSVFPENKDKLFNLISRLYVEPIWDKNIIVRYNGINIPKADISGPTHIRYEIALANQLEKEWLGENFENDFFKILEGKKRNHYGEPRPQLKDVKLNIFDNKEIIFEIKTKKGKKNND